ncbi:MAG: winged helix-turn-helix domain-containing protein [Thermoplasmatales archaeon]|nr:winged helix-turn-helix domain-containing protein [Thermoplasmatales archaeon]
MTVEERIIKFLRQNRGTYTPKEISQALGINYDSVKRTLLRMYRKRIVFKSFRNNYHLFERDKKGQAKGTTPNNKFIDEKVTKGNNERDKITKRDKAKSDDKNESMRFSNSFQTFIQTLPHVTINDAFKNNVIGTRIKIYKLLIHGYPKSKIATILKINKATVQYHTNILEKQKIVKRAHGSKSPILYTPAEYSSSMEKNYYKNIIPKIVGDDSSPKKLCRVHCDNYVFKILEQPKIIPPWHQSWNAKNTNYREFTILLNDWDKPVRVRQIQNDLLVIFMPETYLDAYDLKNYENILQARVLGVAAWLQKKYGYRLGLVERYQKPHYAFPEDPSVVTLAKRFNLSASDVWMDDSDGHPEWETNDIELAKIKIEEPKLVKEIINKMRAQDEVITRIIKHCPLLKPLEERDDLKGYT